MIKEVEITPSKPTLGDLLAITVRGDRGQKVPIELHYEQSVPVKDNAFTMQMNRIQVPWPKNQLSIEVTNVATLNISAKFLLWISKKVDVVKGIGHYILKDVPKGTYSIKLNGTATHGTSNVTIKIAAFSELQLDENGSCVYTFQPDINNTGNIAVKCNEIEKRVEIKKS